MTLKCTRLCYWIALPGSPVVQSSNTSRECFTVISHVYTRAFSLLSHTYSVQTEFGGFWLIILTQKKVISSWIFFKFAICSIALLSLGKTCHLMGRDIVTVWRTLLLLSCRVSTSQHSDFTWSKYVPWRRTMHERVMNILYQTWIAQA